MLLDYSFAFGLLLTLSGLKKFFEEEDSNDLFWPRPGSAPWWIWPKCLKTFLSTSPIPKFHQNPSSGTVAKADNVFLYILMN